MHAQMRVGKQGQYTGHYGGEVARTPPGVVLVVHFCVFDAMPEFIFVCASTYFAIYTWFVYTCK
jgi:hypothetical protein